MGGQPAGNQRHGGQRERAGKRNRAAGVYNLRFAVGYQRDHDERGRHHQCGRFADPPFGGGHQGVEVGVGKRAGRFHGGERKRARKHVRCENRQDVVFGCAAHETPPRLRLSLL